MSKADQPPLPGGHLDGSPTGSVFDGNDSLLDTSSDAMGAQGPRDLLNDGLLGDAALDAALSDLGDGDLGATESTSGAEAGADAGPTIVASLDARDGAELAIADLTYIYDATFIRQGSDLLLVKPDGTAILIENYFAVDLTPDLVGEGGRRVTAELIDSFLMPEAPGQSASLSGDQLAQANGEPIGTVENLTGTVTAVRPDGTVVELQAGDPVFQGDQIVTSDGSSVKIGFIDETIFTLGSDARLALDEMVFNPATQSGESAFSILKGGFLFVSGQIAETNPNDMTVNTPVATIGIRGTIVTGEVAGVQTADGETFRFTVVDGEIAVNAGGQTVILSDNFSTVSGQQDADGQTRVFEFVESPQNVIARNSGQFRALDSNDLAAIEQAIEQTIQERTGEVVDIDLEGLVETVIEQEDQEQNEEQGEEAPEEGDGTEEGAGEEVIDDGPVEEDGAELEGEIPEEELAEEELLDEELVEEEIVEEVFIEEELLTEEDIAIIDEVFGDGDGQLTESELAELEEELNLIELGGLDETEEERIVEEFEDLAEFEDNAAEEETFEELDDFALGFGDFSGFDDGGLGDEVDSSIFIDTGSGAEEASSNTENDDFLTTETTTVVENTGPTTVTLSTSDIGSGGVVNRSTSTDNVVADFSSQTQDLSVTTGSGNDTITGGSGSDNINAGAGDDTVVGGHGNGDDTFDGGEGSDTLTFDSVDSSTNLTVTLYDPSGTTTITDGGAMVTDTDTVMGMEHIRVGDGDDTVTVHQLGVSVDGDLGSDRLDLSNISDGVGLNLGSGAGSSGTLTFDFTNFESFTMGSGDDTVTVTSLTDNTLVTGGGGTDSVDLRNLTDGFTITRDGTIEITDADGTLTGFSGFEGVGGSQGDDVFSLTYTDVHITGDAGGNDTLVVLAPLESEGTTTLTYAETLSGSGGGQIYGVETIDLSALSGNNAISLSVSSEAIFKGTSSVTLTILGSSSDNVIFSNDGWAEVTADGETSGFQTFTSNSGTLVLTNALATSAQSPFKVYEPTLEGGTIGDVNWNVAGAWTTQFSDTAVALPQNGDSVVLQASDPGNDDGQATVNLADGSSLSLTSLTGNNGLDLGETVDDGTVVSLGSMTTLEVTEFLSLTPQTAGGTNHPQLEVDASGVLILGKGGTVGELDVDGGRIEIQDGSLVVTQEISFNNGDFIGTKTLNDFQELELDNQTLSGTGTISGDGTQVNQGTASFGSGSRDLEFVLDADMVNDGTLSFDNDDLFTGSGTITNNGTISFPDSEVFTLGVDVVNESGATIDLFAVNDGEGATIHLNDATITNKGVLDFNFFDSDLNHTFPASDVVFQGSGAVVFESGGSWDADYNNQIQFTDSTTFSIGEGVRLQFDSDSPGLSFDGSSVIGGQGTFTNSYYFGSGNDITLGIASFENAGTFNNGSLTILSGSTFTNQSGGAYEVADGATDSVAGVLDLRQGTVSHNDYGAQIDTASGGTIIIGSDTVFAGDSISMLSLDVNAGGTLQIGSGETVSLEDIPAELRFFDQSALDIDGVWSNTGSSTLFSSSSVTTIDGDGSIVNTGNLQLDEEVVNVPIVNQTTDGTTTTHGTLTFGSSDDVTLNGDVTGGSIVLGSSAGLLGTGSISDLVELELGSNAIVWHTGGIDADRVELAGSKATVAGTLDLSNSTIWFSTDPASLDTKDGVGGKLIIGENTAYDGGSLASSDLTIDVNTDGTLEIGAGQTISLDGAGPEFRFDYGSTLDVNGVWTNTGTSTIFSSSQDTTINGTGSIVNTGNLLLDEDVVNVSIVNSTTDGSTTTDGILTLGQGDDVTFNGGVSGGTIVLEQNAGLLGSGSITDLARLELGNNATVSSTGFVNTGTIELTSSAATINGSVDSSNGALDLGESGVLTIGDSGTLSIGENTTYSGGGTISISSNGALSAEQGVTATLGVDSVGGNTVATAQILDNSSATEPDVAVLTNGNIVSVWDNGSNIAGMIVNPTTGATVNVFTIDPFSGGSVGNPSVAARTDGTFRVVYGSGSSSATNTLTTQLFTSSGSESGSPLTLALLGGDIEDTDLSAMANGGFATVETQTGGDVAARTFNSSGTSVGYFNPPSNAEGDVSTGSLSNGDIVFTYAEATDGGYAVEAAFLDAGGTTDTDTIISGFNVGTSPQVAVLSNDNMVIVYTEADAVKFEIINTSGAEVVGKTALSGATTSTEDFDVVATSDGGFVISYPGSNGTDFDVYAQKFTSLGVTDGALINVNDAGDGSSTVGASGDQASTVLAMLDDDKFATVYENGSGTVALTVSEFDAPAEGAVYKFGTDASLRGQGTFVNTGTVDLTDGTVGVNVTFDNDGLLQASGNDQRRLTIETDNFDNSGGTIRLEQTANNVTRLVIAGDTFTNTGTIQMEAGGSSGATRIDDSPTTGVGSEVFVNETNGVVEVLNGGQGASLRISTENRGTFSLADDLTVSSNLDMDNGAISLAASSSVIVGDGGNLTLGTNTDFQGGGTLHFTGDSSLTIDSGQNFTYAAGDPLVTFAGNDQTWGGDGTLTNAGSLNLDGDLTLSVASVVNTGTLGLAGTLASGSVLDNNSQLTVTTDNADIDGNIDNADGTFTVAGTATATMDGTLTGGPIVLEDAATLAGSGPVTGVSTLSLGNGANVSNTGTVTAETIELTGATATLSGVADMVDGLFALGSGETFSVTGRLLAGADTDFGDLGTVAVESGGTIGIASGETYTNAATSDTTDFAVNTVTTGDQLNPDIARLSNGNYVIAWETDGTPDNIGYFRVVDAAGNTVVGQTEIDTQSASFLPRVIETGNGTFAILFNEDDGADINARLNYYAADGSLSSSDTSVTNRSGAYDALDVSNWGTDGEVIVAHQSGASDLTARFLGTGAHGSEVSLSIDTTLFSGPRVEPIGTNEVIIVYADGSEGTDVSLAILNATDGTTSHQRVIDSDVGATGDIDVTVLSNGNAVVVWENSDNIMATIVDSDGGTVVAAFQVDSHSGVANPNVTALDAGGFQIFYEASGTGTDIYARAYSASGVAQEGAYVVASDTTGEQIDVIAAPGQSGSDKAAFVYTSPDANGTGIFMGDTGTSGAIVELKPGSVLAGPGTFLNQGDMILDGVTLAADATFDNDGTLTIGDGGFVILGEFDNSDGTMALEDNSTITLSGGGTTTLDGEISMGKGIKIESAAGTDSALEITGTLTATNPNNNGEISADLIVGATGSIVVGGGDGRAGSLTISGGFTNNGFVQVDPTLQTEHGVLIVEDDFTNVGTLQVDNAATLTVGTGADGTLTNTGVMMGRAHDVTVTGVVQADSIVNTGTLDLPGVLGGDSSTLTFEGLEFNNLGGAITVGVNADLTFDASTLKLGSSSTLVTASSADVVFENAGATLELGDGMTLTNTGVYTLNSGAAIGGSGTFLNQDAMTLDGVTIGSSATFENNPGIDGENGEVTVTGVGTLTVDGALNSDASATFTVADGGVLAGSDTITNDAELEVSGVSIGAGLTYDGDVALDSVGSVTVDGTLTGALGLGSAGGASIRGDGGITVTSIDFDGGSTLGVASAAVVQTGIATLDTATDKINLASAEWVLGQGAGFANSNGTLVVNGGSTLSVADNASFAYDSANMIALDLASAGVAATVGGQGTFSNVAGSALSMTDPVTFSVSSFANAGTIAVDSDTITFLSDTVSNTGTLEANAATDNAVLSFDGTQTVGGVIELNNSGDGAKLESTSGMLTITGELISQDPTGLDDATENQLVGTIVNQGTIGVDHVLDVASDGVLDSRDGTLSVADRLETSGEIVLGDESAVSGGGTIQVKNGGSISVASGESFTISAPEGASTGISFDTEFNTHSSTSGTQDTPEGVLLSNGHIATIWNSDGATVRVFDASGNPQPSGEILIDPGQETANQHWPRSPAAVSSRS